MTFRATGPGRIEINPRYNGAGILRALLYNFDFDDMSVMKLKKEHAEFIKTRALPLLANNRGMVMLLGQASQIGTNEYNLTLSRQRVQRVVDFFVRNGATSNQIRPDAVGEEQSRSPLRDDERDRSVEFVIVPRTRHDTRPPRRVPPPPPVTKQFRLRQAGSLTHTGLPKPRPTGRIGVGPAADGMLFQIEDIEHRYSAFYGFSGIGLGLGFNAAWLSGTDTGPWNNFSTSAPMNVGDFGGFTRFTTAGGGNRTVNWLHMLGTPKGVDAVYIQINTGTTYGIGASTTAGPLQLVAGPYPSSGN
jgi:hypothetical protein